MRRCPHGLLVDEDCGRCRAEVFAMKAAQRERRRHVGWLIGLFILLLVLLVIYGALWLDEFP